MPAAWLTVVETAEFQRATGRWLSSQERDELIAFLAVFPEAGVIVPGTGGIRKPRWRLGAKGKRGGARVIYFFRSDRHPLYLLTAYSKSQRDDLTSEQKRALRALVEHI